jgi:type IV secretion system protein VirB4
MTALRAFRHAGPSFADLVPYAALVANGVILLKDGSLMAGWYFAGPDSESSTDAERNEVSRQINADPLAARIRLDDPGRGRARPTSAYPSREGLPLSRSGHARDR